MIRFLPVRPRPPVVAIECERRDGSTIVFLVRGGYPRIERTPIGRGTLFLRDADGAVVLAGITKARTLRRWPTREARLRVAHTP